MTEKPVVGVVVGSRSDLPQMEEGIKALDRFGIPYETVVASAHRSPAQVSDYAAGAAGRGIKVIIAAAGLAAHLAGSIAARTSLPVIGVPMEAGPLKGVDALLSTVQMPPGVPVAAMGIGKAGAINAAVMAAEILALADADIRRKLEDYKKSLSEPR